MATACGTVSPTKEESLPSSVEEFIKKRIKPSKNIVFDIKKNVILKDTESFLSLVPKNNAATSKMSLDVQKVLPPDSQTENQPTFSCGNCEKSFTSKSGRTNHQNSCVKKSKNCGSTDHHPETNNSLHPDIHVPPIQATPAVWGNHSAEDVKMIINAIYEECVKWKKNLFLLPSGRIGKDFVDEMTRLIHEWINDSPLHEIALKALMIMPAILLQKSNKNSKAKENADTLKRRFLLWQNGDFDSLVREVRYIQSNLNFKNSSASFEEKAKRFNDLMTSGKVKSALRLLSEVESAGILPLTDETLNLLHQKHPDGEEKYDDLLLNGPEQLIGDYAYEKIDGSLIRKLASQLKGAAGPSSLDADGWRRILTSASFGMHSVNLCDAVARMTRKICCEDGLWRDDSLESLLACRLIPLDKCPGLRPIAIGEVLRRIVGKAVIRIMKPRIMESVGDLQMCGGQKAGCEAAIHALRMVFDEDDCDGILLVDADNAFNRINRQVLLHNIKIVCPELAIFVINTYKKKARLFMSGGKEIKSSEGTSQGDPVAFPLYALALAPLLETIETADVKHVAYADDLSSGGKLKQLLIWWKKLQKYGPLLGYFPNASKTWLIVKPEVYELAKIIFKETGIRITKDGKRHLGAVIGTADFKSEYIAEFVDKWVSQILVLSRIARSYPQSAYCAFTSGFVHKFNHIIRTIPDAAAHLQPVEDAIRHQFIPAISEGRSCNDLEREILSLPVKMGGMGLIDLTKISEVEFKTSMRSTVNLVNKIVNQNTKEVKELSSTNIEATSIGRKEFYDQKLVVMKEKMSTNQLKALDIACTHGASVWLSSLPLKDENFCLTKREFFDAVYLRYGWDMTKLPTDCVCGAKFQVNHALQCKVGGFIHLRHNELVNETAKLAASVCKDVEKEPILLRRSENDPDIRADISMRSFWQRQQKAFVDVRVFYPYARSYANQNLSNTFSKMEKEKKKKYNNRVIDQEHGSFTPLIFSSNGGMSKETKRFYGRLSELLAEKNGSDVSETAAYVKRKLAFSLIRSAVICIRGSRSIHQTKYKNIENNSSISDADTINLLSKIS